MLSGRFGRNGPSARGNGRVRRDKLSGVTRPVPEIRNLGNDFSLRLRRIAS